MNLKENPLFMVSGKETNETLSWHQREIVNCVSTQWWNLFKLYSFYLMTVIVQCKKYEKKLKNTENCMFYSLINFLCPILLFEKLIGSLVKIRKRT